MSAVGVGTFGSLDISGDIDVDGHTNLDNVSVAGVSTFSDHVLIPDDKELRIGDSADLKLKHTTSLSSIASGGVNNFTIRQSAGNGFLFIHGDQLHLRSQSTNEPYLIATNNGPVSLYFDHNNHNTAKLVTSATGVTINGTAVAGGLDISGDIDVDGHTNLDNVSIAGVVTATSFSGDGSNLTGITGTTINNNADNRVITGSGSANTLEGEANLTFDGDKLILTKNPLNTATITTTNCLTLGLRIGTDGTGSNTEGHIYNGLAVGDGYAGLYGKDGGSGAATDLEFFTGTASAVAGRLRIQDDGKIIMGGNVSQSINRNVTIVAPTGNSQDVQLGLQPTNSSGGYNPEVYIGATADGTTGAAMYFYTRDTSGNRAERLPIDSSGKLLLGDGSYNNNSNGFKMSIKESSNENAAIMFLDTDNMKGGICGIAKGNDQIITGTTNVDFVLGSVYADTHIIYGTPSNQVGAIGMTLKADTGHIVIEEGLGIGGVDPGGSTLKVNGSLNLSQGGNTSWQKVTIEGSNNTAGDALSINNWGDAEGDYWGLMVNQTMNQSGNYSKTNSGKRTSFITLDGRMGRVYLGGSSTSGNPTEHFYTNWDGTVYMNAGFGSVAPFYGVRAWVQGNSGTTNGSGGLSSMSRVSTGNYRLNFATTMPDDNYATGCLANNNYDDTSWHGNTDTTGVNVYFYTGSSYVDPSEWSAWVIR